ncbi:hypothetical protein [Marixanthomonas ophiurae]|uniref:Flagellar motor protein MotB n=1 Tax=Marixanthomonas ophiurae TaxID=387659 RepID=A0A3E1QB58_9FLAO|nr:hypothetical protein [Marixanthomonas ophiurae]RFN59379.1 hypothetical protein DZ858_04740 [Marixanthomonas ophiurae]
MKRFPLALFLLLFCVSFTITAQNSATEKNIDVNKDVDVIKVYEQVVKEGYGTPFIYKKLANAHYFKNNYGAAKKWFEKLFSIEKPTDETLKYRYKQSLKALSSRSSENKDVTYSGTN